MDKPPAPMPTQAPPSAPQPTPITSPVPVMQPQQPALLSPKPLEWLIRSKPSALLLALKSGGEQHISNLAKKSSMSYVHALEILKVLEEKGIVTSESRGNKRFVKLTDAGLAFVSALEELVKKAPAKKV